MKKVLALAVVATNIFAFSYVFAGTGQIGSSDENQMPKLDLRARTYEHIGDLFEYSHVNQMSQINCELGPNDLNMKRAKITLIYGYALQERLRVEEVDNQPKAIYDQFDVRDLEHEFKLRERPNFIIVNNLAVEAKCTENAAYTKDMRTLKETGSFLEKLRVRAEINRLLK